MTLRIANCSGFFGDRMAAAREMVDGGPIDVLTGDWLAELTMGILGKQHRRNADAGFAATFLTQLEDVLADCLDRGIKVVSNAGGVNTDACVQAVRGLAARLGRPVRVAQVSGDDATQLCLARFADGWKAPHQYSGVAFPYSSESVQLASAYLGGWGIAAALDQGADVVVTGRVSDASLTLGPAAWHYGWARDDWDVLAGAVAAGHVIECGAQATGGNYSFFTDIDDLSHCGFPLAEVERDGSCVITKHPGTGGAVTVGTVTAQLLYEVDGPRYLNPDVVARLDTVIVEQAGPDRVRMRGTRGEPAPKTLKVGVVHAVGWRNAATFVLTGADVEQKARVAQEAMWRSVPGGRDAYESCDVLLLRTDRQNPTTLADATSLLRVAVRDADRSLVDRFSRVAVEIALASYPGLCLTDPPSASRAVDAFWPTLMEASSFPQLVEVDGQATYVTATPHQASSAETLLVAPPPPAPTALASDTGESVTVPLGSLVGGRSGDKGANATLGLWARDDRTFAWLTEWLTADRLRNLAPELRERELRMWWLPNLRAGGCTVIDLLDQGAASNLTLDGQAKGLAEYIRAKLVRVPPGVLGQ